MDLIADKEIKILFFLYILFTKLKVYYCNIIFISKYIITNHSHREYIKLFLRKHVYSFPITICTNIIQR